MIKTLDTHAAKHAAAVKIAEKVASTAIDASRGPQHAALRRAEIQAQADFLVKLYELNGWDLNCLLYDTLSSISEARAKATAAAVRDASAQDVVYA